MAMCARWTPPLRWGDAADEEKYVLKKFFMLEPEESVTVAGSRQANTWKRKRRGIKKRKRKANIFLLN